MALPLPSAPLQAKFPRSGRSIRQLKKLYFFLTSLAVEACSSFADPGRRQYASCTGTSLQKIPRKLAAGGFCENGSRQISEPSLMIRTISKSSVATAGDDIGYITAW